jgi:hypothetical protein
MMAGVQDNALLLSGICCGLCGLCFDLLNSSASAASWLMPAAVPMALAMRLADDNLVCRHRRTS